MTVEQHPSDVVLLAVAAGTVDEAQRIALGDHVRGCARCRTFVGAMEHIGGVVLEKLPPTPLTDESLAKVMAQLEQLTPSSAVATSAGVSDHVVMPRPGREEHRWWFGQWIAPGQRLRTGVAGAALIALSLGITYLAAEYAFFHYADDYAASTATTGKVAIGGSTTSNIERPGDADWFKVTLASGKSYRFHLEGSDTGQGTLQYPVLRLLDSDGQELHSDAGSVDGPGPGWTSVVTYTAPSSGTYHVSCETSGKHTDTYKVSATEL